MRRNLSMGILAALVAAAVFPAGAPASVTITVEPEPGLNTFEPSSATLDLGDGSFDFQWGPDGNGSSDVHNALQDDALFTTGDPVTSRPPYNLTASAGSYRYFCVVHLGMVGDVNVRPVLAGGDKGKGAIKVSWASKSTTTGNRFDVRYRTGKKWKKWQKKTKKTGGKFGKKRKPEKVKKGKTYQFEVRSRQGKDRSDWSPRLEVKR